MSPIHTLKSPIYSPLSSIHTLRSPVYLSSSPVYSPLSPVHTISKIYDPYIKPQPLLYVDDPLNKNNLVKSYLSTLYYPRTITMPQYDYSTNSTVLDNLVDNMHNKIINNWLQNDKEMNKILNYLIIKNDNITVANSIKNQKDNEKNKRRKAHFIGDYILTKSKLKSWILKFSEKSDVPLTDLVKVTHKIKKYLTLKLHNKFKNNNK
jgi:hypothetical protein